MQGSKNHGVTLFLIFCAFFAIFLLLFCFFFAPFWRRFGSFLGAFLGQFSVQFWMHFVSEWYQQIVGMSSNLFQIWYLKWWFLGAILDAILGVVSDALGSNWVLF